MNGRLGLLVVVLTLAPLLQGCKPEPVVVREVTDDDLRAMALRLDDLPPGFTVLSERLTDNESFAKDFKEPERIREMVDGWGRGAGFDSVFSSNGSADRPRFPALAASLVERYPDVGRARQRFIGAGDLLDQRQSQASKPAPVQVKAVRLTEEYAITRHYLTDDKGYEMVVYVVAFRKGAVFAEVRTAAPKHKDDRGEHAVRLAHLVHERVAKRLTDQ
ncbi:MAG: hypothetical protein U0531_15100 [Dehalococcoidia bacterium]